MVALYDRASESFTGFVEYSKEPLVETTLV